MSKNEAGAALEGRVWLGREVGDGDVHRKEPAVVTALRLQPADSVHNAEHVCI